MNIIFLGAPGSGKGTQAAMLSTKLKVPAISTGETLRREVEQQSEIGKLAKSYMESGRLVPDKIIIDIVKIRLLNSDCDNGFILDGFPRTTFQAEELEKILDSFGKKIDHVFNFEIDEETLVKRISGRFSCKGCGAIYNHYFKPTIKNGLCDNCGSTEFEGRSDDNEEAVKNRLKIYRESTYPLTQFYQKKNLLVLISSVKGAPLVFEALIEALKSSSKKF
jgi:adenylate kinase